MHRSKWDEMRLQEEQVEEERGGTGQASGDGLAEGRRRPIGFGRDHGVIEVVSR